MKAKIRDEILKLRDKLPVCERNECSGCIMNKLFNIPEFKQASSILFYVSKGSEVETELMIKEAMLHGKKVAVPFVNKETNEIVPYYINDYDNDLEPGSFGILEPKKEKRLLAPVKEIEMIIVPGTAFDKKGNRIGYGHGFYDKLLTGADHVTILALAYDCQVVDSIPEEVHDIRVRKIITESGVINT